MRCGATKADGSPCRAFALRGRDICAGHAGLGLAANPGEAGRVGAAKSAEVRAERAEIRKRGIKQALADAVEKEYLDDILAAYGRGLTDPDAAVAVRSAEAILSRVYGKPKELIETLERPAELAAVAEMTREERDSLWRRLHEQEIEEAA